MIFPLAVLPDRTHGSIITPEESDLASINANQARLSQLLLQALRCANMADYHTIQKNGRCSVKRQPNEPIMRRNSMQSSPNLRCCHGMKRAENLKMIIHTCK